MSLFATGRKFSRPRKHVEGSGHAVLTETLVHSAWKLDRLPETLLKQGSLAPTLRPGGLISRQAGQVEPHAVWLFTAL